MEGVPSAEVKELMRIKGDYGAWMKQRREFVQGDFDASAKLILRRESTPRLVIAWQLRSTV